jgi:hypothetical protein
MADQVEGSVTGGNGERLSLQLGTKSFGVQARDLIPILLLLMLGVGGYLLFTNVRDTLQSLQRQHDMMQGVLHENQVKILGVMNAWQQAITAQTEEIRGITEEQSKALYNLMLTHEYNQGREPHDRLPLGMAPEQHPKPR